jgi:hypothetical protein
MTYDPGITVIAQGGKRVELGRNNLHLRCLEIPADVHSPGMATGETLTKINKGLKLCSQLVVVL